MEVSDQAKHDAILAIIRASEVPESLRDNLVRGAHDPAKWRDFRDGVIHHVDLLSDLPDSPVHRRAAGRLILALKAVT